MIIFLSGSFHLFFPLLFPFMVVFKDRLYNAVIRVENVLSESEGFKLQELQARFKSPETDPIDVILIDVEEQPIERPTYGQEGSYSGKKKRHTTKYQLVADGKTLEILDVYNDVGSVHDFRMFKESVAGMVPENVVVLADSGYQGINTYVPHAVIPVKSGKKHQLTDEEKAFNTEHSKKRIGIEHINRGIKIFRICKETYRNKGRRGLLRVKLIAALYNLRIIS